jgi:hypothetical protein
MKTTRFALLALAASVALGGTALAQRAAEAVRPIREFPPTVRPGMNPAIQRTPPAPRVPLEQRTPPGHVREQVAPRLDLSEAQRSKMTVLMQEQREALSAVKADGALSSREKRAKAAEISKTYAEQRRELLSAEQQAKAEAARARAKAAAEARQEAAAKPSTDS